MTGNAIYQWANYGVDKGLIQKEDRLWAINCLLSFLRLDECPAGEENSRASLEQFLTELTDFGVEQGLAAEDSPVFRDLLDTHIMGLLTPPPSVVREKFDRLYHRSPAAATDWYYRFSRDTNYIRTLRVARDKKWTVDTPYGTLDITINLSKPEKDPKAIAMAKNMGSSSYPKCLLCKENEGYAGRVNHPPRQNHRIIPVSIHGEEPWYFQYSPYVYYNEHCIVFNGEHIPMKIDRSAFDKLLSFVELFPHYFVGSNADLPIVGGSILAHEHFQGGRYTFAMERAPVETPLSFEGFKRVTAGIVRWPMSVIRLTGEDKEELAELADKILVSWRNYSDPDRMIYAQTGGEPHNTVTPIARRQGKLFQLDLVLRNNLTTKEHPMGLYHPHEELHHIKKENIGLIEVMGLAVLPARLKTELQAVVDHLVAGTDLRRDPLTEKHARWAEAFAQNREITRENGMEIVEEEVGLVFAKVLEQAGVFSRDERGKAGFLRFAAQVK